jgi:hypothetical protein
MFLPEAGGGDITAAMPSNTTTAQLKHISYNLYQLQALR